MTNEELKAALAELNEAANRKLGEPMYIPMNLNLRGDWWSVDGYADYAMRRRFNGKSDQTPEGAIANMRADVEAWPTPEEANLHEFQRKVAEAIDYGNEKGIAAEWLNPIVEVARTMASNAITKVSK